MKPIAMAKSNPTPRIKVTGNARVRKMRLMNRTLTGEASPVSSTEIHSKINNIKRGYTIDDFEKLKEALGVSKEKLAKIANISLATMHRRKVSSGRLTPDESEKIYRIRKLYETALDVLENKDNVKAWFNTSQVVFEGRTPLEYSDTMPGSEEVERVLRRMEHGIVL